VTDERLLQHHGVTRRPHPLADGLGPFLDSYLAWTRRSRHPEASLLAALAIGLFLFAAIEAGMRPSVVARLGPADVDELLRIMKYRGLINRTIVATAIGHLLWAAFGWRNPPVKIRDELA
jgi:hypothetical protein